jgi:RNA polymerase sigma-70 factor (ECF subfamily)
MRPEIQEAINVLHDGRLDDAVSLLEDTVYAFSMRVCGHPEDAEDNAQEVLVRALPHLPKFENARALSVWLYKVAKNRCLMSRRRSKFAPTRMLSLDELMPDRDELASLSGNGEPTPEKALLGSEQKDLLLEAIRRLAPEYRLVLVLHDMEGLDGSQVAEILGIREGTVRVRLHRARLFVRRELAQLRKSGLQGPRAAEEHRPTPRCRKMFSSLSDYLDGVMDEELCRHFEQHLATCPPCRAFLQHLESVVEGCRDCGRQMPERRTRARLSQRVR